MPLTYLAANNTFLCEPKPDPVDRVQIEVGDAKQADFFPQCKVLRWDNEVNVSMRLVADTAVRTASLADRVITWDEGERVAQFYEIDATHYEFAVLLKRKPASNILAFTLQHKGVNFYHQPPFANVEKDGSTWEAVPDTDMVLHRSAAVSGSYAVYHQTRRDHVVGQKNYQIGKLCHLYRPEAIDAKGQRIWCDLRIDAERNTASITVPQAWLDAAAYPVLVDPTIGISGTPDTMDSANNFLLTKKYIAPEDGNANPGTIYVSADEDGAGASVEIMAAAYLDGDAYPKDSNNTQLSSSVTLTVAGPTQAWYSNSITWLNITGATSYWLSVNCIQDGDLWYDVTTDADEIYYIARTHSGTMPDPHTNMNGNHFHGELGVYVTYTGAGGGGIPRRNPFSRPFRGPLGGSL